jgi:iron complex outermembrane receptor protein
VRKIIGVMGVAASLIPTGVIAQTTAALEEVVVTAQRRQESLQEVPISLVAFSGTTLEAQNIKEAQDYLLLTPNVSFSEEAQGGGRNIGVAIRGVNNISVLENRGGGSAIGYYFDEVSLAQVSQGTANPQLIDIERVEVLRGPQGTFFGLNATGGAINLITNAPRPEKSAKVTMELGNFSQWAVSAVGNLPLSDSFFVRGAFAAEDSPAVVKNVNPVGGDSATRNRTARISTRFAPSEAFEIVTRVTHTTEQQDLEELVSTCRLSRSAQNLMSLDRGVKTLGFPAPVAVGITGYVDEGLGCFPETDDRMNKSVRYDDGSRGRELYDGESLMASNQIVYKTGDFELKSITGHVSTEVDSRFDLDGSSLRYINRRNRLDTDAWSQELRLSSSGERLDWVVGGIYFDSSQSRYNIITADEDRFFVFPPRSTANEFFQTTEVKTWALFGDASLRVGERLTFTAGGRYSESNSDQCAENLSPGAQVAFFCATTAKTTDFSPRFVAKLQWSPDVMAYASASRGYKPGGVQVEGTQFLGRYRPSYFAKETLWNYELGLKATLLDSRVLINVAAFNMDWRELQVDDTVFTVDTSTNRTVTATFVRSAKKASSKGVELDFVARPVDSFLFGAGLGYTDARFGAFNGVARPQGLGPIDLTDEAIPGAPKITANTFVEYRFALGAEPSYVRAEGIYRDEMVPNLDGYFYKVTSPALLGFIRNDGNPYPFVVPSFKVVNLRAGTSLGPWQITAHIENALGEDYFTGARYGFNVTGVQVRPHPRLYGIQLSRSW